MGIVVKMGRRASVATLLLLYLALDGCVTEVSAATRVHHRHRERNHEEQTEAVPVAPEVNKTKKRDRRTKYGRAKAFIGSQWQKYEKLVFTKNVVDVAMGLMIGTAMTTLINSVVQNIMTPISVDLSMPGKALQHKFVVIKPGESGKWDYTKNKNGQAAQAMADEDGAVTLKYGAASNDAIEFVFITIAIFLCKQLTSYVATKISEIDYESYLDKIEDRIGLEDVKHPKCCDGSTPDPPHSYPNVCADGSAGIAYDRECPPKMEK